MQKNIISIMEYLHVFLIVSMIAPFIYIIYRHMETDQIYRIYFASYILIVPVIVFMKAMKGCKSFVKFLLIFLGLCFLIKIGAKQLSLFLLNKKTAQIYIVCMLVSTVLIAFVAFTTRIYRIRRKIARDTKDVAWTEEGFQIDKPKSWITVVFIIMYVIGMFRTCAPICNLALYHSLFYLMVTIVHKYMNELAKYLKLNKSTYQVKNIPYLRIYEIRRLYLVGCLVLLFLTLIPAILTVNNRKYINIPDKFQVELTAEDIYIQAPSEEPPDPKKVPVQPFIIIPRPIEYLLGALMYLVAISTVLVAVFAIISAIHRKIVEFSNESEEAEDIIDLSESFKDNEEILVYSEQFLLRG